MRGREGKRERGRGERNRKIREGENRRKRKIREKGREEREREVSRALHRYIDVFYGLMLA